MLIRFVQATPLAQVHHAVLLTEFILSTKSKSVSHWCGGIQGT